MKLSFDTHLKSEKCSQSNPKFCVAYGIQEVLVYEHFVMSELLENKMTERWK